MPRLFVALDVPQNVKTDLIRMQLPSDRGIRNLPPDQLHLTLHFLGEAELTPVVEALSRVVAPVFSAAIDGVGRFGSSQRGFILWAGFRPNTELMTLHATIAEALSTTGYQPETRTFCPHVTLARCKPWAPLQRIEAFLQRHKSYVSPDFAVTEFLLYSSELTPQGALYRCIKRFPLLPGGALGESPAER